MRKKLTILIVLALILSGMIYLRTQKNKEEDKPAEKETEETLDVVEVNSDVTLGMITQGEAGGIVITVPQEDGTEKAYTFTDVEADSWYADAVNYVVSAGLMQGSEDGPIFLPEYGIQRLEYAIVIFRYANGEFVPDKCAFADISGREWFSQYVDWIGSKRYMGGVDGENFAPFGYLTVEQAIVVLYRMAGEPYDSGSTLESYPYAAKITPGAEDAITWAWNSGLITEEECVWYPTQAISRAQVALLLMRYCRK